MHCSYSLHNEGWAYLGVRDQTQTVVVELLNTAACAVRHSSATDGAFLQHCMQHLALAVCKQYKDPYSVHVSTEGD